MVQHFFSSKLFKELLIWDGISFASLLPDMRIYRIVKILLYAVSRDMGTRCLGLYYMPDVIFDIG